MLSFLLNKPRDFFSLLTLLAVAIFVLLGLYWLAALAVGAIALLFGLTSHFTAKLFRWPVKNVSIPLALALQVGKNRPAAWLGIILVNLCLAASLVIIKDFHTPAVRRIGQSIAMNNAKLGGIGDKLEALAQEIVGRQRLNRWSEWLWAENAQTDDTLARYGDGQHTIAQSLFRFSDRIADTGVNLQYRIYEGEHHAWFLYLYWFVAAVFIPCSVVSFLVTVFQLSARRLSYYPGHLTVFTVSLMTLFITYCLFAAAYLMPFVSHPYHNMGVPFWLATFLYLAAGMVCFGLIRANQQVLYTPEETPKSFTNTETVRIESPRPIKKMEI